MVQVSYQHGTTDVYQQFFIMHALRQALRQKRRAISAIERQTLARQLQQQVQKSLKISRGQTVALFLPNDGEIDPIYINNILKKQGISVYLPKLFGKSLVFAKIGKHFSRNRFGIPEPLNTPIKHAHQLSLIFTPLVGFDQNRNRIGMGGGFYDRTLSFKHRQHSFQHPKLYGLAFDCQEVATLERQNWDVPLDGVITPSRRF